MGGRDVPLLGDVHSRRDPVIQSNKEGRRDVPHIYLSSGHALTMNQIALQTHGPDGRPDVEVLRLPTSSRAPTRQAGVWSHTPKWRKVLQHSTAHAHIPRLMGDRGLHDRRRPPELLTQTKSQGRHTQGPKDSLEGVY